MRLPVKSNGSFVQKRGCLEPLSQSFCPFELDALPYHAVSNKHACRFD